MTVAGFQAVREIFAEVFAEIFVMTRHLTRLELARSIAAAASAMILCAVVLFSAAHHLAG
jgi:hypothetical protein